MKGRSVTYFLQERLPGERGISTTLSRAKREGPSRLRKDREKLLWGKGSESMKTNR